MIVTVRFFTTLKEITRKEKEKIEVPSSTTVEDMVNILSMKYGDKFSSYVYDQKGQPRSRLQFFVNWKNISISQGLKTQLKDCDEVAIIPPVSGG